jgi:hypothetical protein
MMPETFSAILLLNTQTAPGFIQPSSSLMPGITSDIAPLIFYAVSGAILRRPMALNQT